MALVAYSDESDYEDGDEETETVSLAAVVTQNNDRFLPGVIHDGTSQTTVDTPEITHEVRGEADHISDDEYEGHSTLSENVSKISLFASVPLPTKAIVDAVEEEVIIPDRSEKELEAAKALEEEKRKLKESKQKGKVRIVLPSLTDFLNDDLQQRKEKPVVTGKSGSGLLSMLPQPKQGVRKELNRPLIPNSLMKPKTSIEVKKTTIRQEVKITSNKTSVQRNGADSDDEGVSSDFFSLSEKEVIDVAPVPLEDIIGTSNPRKRAVSPVAQSNEADAAQSYTEEVQYAQYSEMAEQYPQAPSAEQLDEEALIRLHGKRARRGEPIQFKEVSEDAIRPDPKEWLKQLSVEKSSMPTSYSASKKDGPDAVSRRKHQMTYLVHQAKAREVELKNQWANNRQTKRQTQSKYGF